MNADRERRALVRTVERATARRDRAARKLFAAEQARRRWKRLLDWHDRFEAFRASLEKITARVNEMAREFATFQAVMEKWEKVIKDG